MRGSCSSVVIQFYVINPAVNDSRDQLFNVEPNIVPFFLGLGTEIVDCVGFVELGFDLTATIAGNWKGFTFISLLVLFNIKFINNEGAYHQST